MSEPRTVLDETLAERDEPNRSDGGGLIDSMTAQSGGGWPADERPPRRLGRYDIVRRLGEGGMGVVYEGVDPRAQRSVAIKSIRRLKPKALYRFKREFRSLVRVQHPNVVTLHELFFEDGRLFFTMELVDGTDLTRYLCGVKPRGAEQHTPCRDYERLRDATAQLVAGVHAIHCEGLLHRDIKPSNVRVSSQGRVVLLDFGLVQEHEGGADPGMTEDGVVLGTPLYMAPEQVTKVQVGPAADWYAVGGLLYEALTGRPPFQGTGILAILAAKQFEEAPAPSSLVDGVPSDLESLCLDLLAKDPEARPRGEALLERVAGWGQGAPSAASSSTTSRLVPASTFLGRDEEHEALRDAAAEARRRRRPVVAFVDGVSGMGKSALVERFLEEVRADPEALVLQGRCSERESIPYKALDSVMDALSAHLQRADATMIDAVLPREPRAAARLFPVLLSIPSVALAPDGLETGNDPQIRRRAFAALRELLGRLGARRRLVLYIDDLQWMDLDSAVLLDAIIRDAEAPPLLLVGTFRTGAEHGQGPLPRLVDELAGDARVDLRRIHVGPLAAPDAARLALQLLGERDPATRALADEVAREAEGSPFFVGELVRYAQQVAEEAQLPPTASSSSVSLDSVIRHRIRVLPSAARRVLEVVALAGGSVPRGVALEVAMGDVRDSQILTLLHAESLVRSGGSSDDDELQIYHDRIRETALRGIRGEHKAELHLALARAFEATGDADAVALSHHFRQAGEEQRATRHTLEAAEQAEAALAYDRAAELYRAVLSMQALDVREVPEVEARLAEALANAGQLYDGAQAYLRAAQGDVTPEMRFEWRRRAAEHLLTTGHGDEGRQVLGTVLDSVGLSLPKGMARSVASLMRHRMALGVRGLKVRLRDPDRMDAEQLRQMDAAWTASRGLVYLDGIAGADFHARHLRMALRFGDPLRISRALGNEAHVTTFMKPNKVDRAQALLAEAERLADDADDIAARGFVVECRGHMWIAVGHWERAHEELSRAITIFREEAVGMAQELAYCEAHAAVCLFFMGRLHALADKVGTLVQEATESANPYVAGYARGMSSSVLLARDDVEGARHELEIYEREAPAHFEAHKLNYAAQVDQLLRYTGEHQAAWDSCEARYPEARKLTVVATPMPKAELLLWRGACALAGASAAAEPELLVREAERQAAKLLRSPLPHGQAYGYLTRAGARGLRGREEEAIADLRSAIDLAESRSMATHVATAQRRLAALLGGSEGQRLRQQSDRYMEAEGIVSPERLTDMVAPGFVRAGAG